MKMIALMFLLAGCSVKEHAISRSLTYCHDKGGLDKIHVDVFTDVAICRDGTASRYLEKVPYKQQLTNQ